MRLIARPIDTWPGKLRTNAERETARFSASWTDTKDLLVREAEAIGGRGELILQMAITERECRHDGWIRADARPSHPGVIVSIESKHGPLTFSTDRYDRAMRWQNGGQTSMPGWQANVRAIALAMEALRAVERHGVGQGHEAYVGWRALGSGVPMGPGEVLTIDEAADLLARVAWPGDAEVEEVHHANVETLVVNPAFVREAYRAAARRVHPDRGGDPEEFRRISAARDLLLR